MDRRLVAALIGFATLTVYCSSSTPAPSDGASCSSPGQIVVKDGCTGCVCESDGRWACPPEGTAGCAQCPTEIHDGDSCSSSGPAECTRYAFCAAPCLCTNGRWSCPTFDSCSAGCPAGPPSGGETCSGTASCHYPWPVQCIEANCTCSAGQWSCTYDSAGCVDAG